MPDNYDPTTWSATMLGIFTLFAAIGALRKPGIWQKLVDEFDKSPALQLLGGGFEMALGAVLYLANPWVPTDILACVMKALGGLMVLEALAVTGFSDIYFHFWLRNLSFMHRGWALATFLIGLALTVAGLVRFA